MDTALIHRLAREAGINPVPLARMHDELTRFAALVAEEAAKVCDEKAQEIRLWCNKVHVTDCAQAIRTRFAELGTTGKSLQNNDLAPVAGGVEPRLGTTRFANPKG